jgi:hypothetical protein
MRQANAWSGWTRLPVGPLVGWALYRRDELGPLLWWVIAALVVWALVNPWVFPVPRSLDTWMSRAVLGTRLWLTRGRTPMPLHYRRALPVIAIFGGSGLALLTWGLLREDHWQVVFGLGLTMLGQLWFLDRMAWYYDDMRGAHPI